MGADRSNVLGRGFFRKAPVFIGGCPRSGTTLLLSILSAHPSIYAVPYEMWSFWETETPDDFRALIDNFLDELSELEIPEYCERICEKTPKNVHVFDRLVECFHPRPRLIHIIRDGRDVVTSIHPNDPTRYWVPVWQWVYDVSVGLRLEASPDLLTIRYEDIVFGFDSTMSKVCEFLGEPFDDRLRRWEENASIRSDPAWFEEVRPLTKKGIGRWTDETHRDVIAELMDSREAVALLDRLGYLSEEYSHVVQS